MLSTTEVSDTPDVWADSLLQEHNDFEKSVFAQAPAIGHIKQQLIEQGALYAAMSGSGSAVYGIFPENKKANIQIEVGFKEFMSKAIAG